LPVVCRCCGLLLVVCRCCGLFLAI
jgi:hypothetical protein